MAGKPVDITPDLVARMVVFTYGMTVNAEPFWVFAAVKPSRYDELLRVTANKTYDINHYVSDGFGEIIVSGEGVLPPNDVVLKVSQLFNVPIRDFFKPIDMDSEIAKEIEKVTKILEESSSS